MRGGPVIRITSRRHLKEVVKNLRDQHRSALLFRGQVHDRVPIPSAARAQPSDSIHIAASSLITEVWETCAHALLSRSQRASLSRIHSRVPAGMAVLQHYGHRSHFIDVSKSLAVGLWFARHKFVKKRIRVFPQKAIHKTGHPLDHAFATVTAASYEPHKEDGFIYIFVVPGDDPTVFLDLERLLPKSFSRVHAQRAGGLLEPVPGAGCESYQVATLVVDTAVDAPGDRTTSMLFPFPERDRAYRALLRVPWIVPTDKIRPYASEARPWPDIPIYTDGSSWPLSALAEIQIVLGMYGRTLKRYEGKLISNVALPISSPSGPKEDFGIAALHGARTSAPTLFEEPSPAAFSCWPRMPLYIQEPATECFSRCVTGSPAYPIHRGFLVERESDTVTITALAEDRDNLLSSPPVSFRWDSEKGWTTVRKADAFIVRRCFPFFLHLTDLLMHHKACLYKTTPSTTSESNYSLYWGAHGESPWNPVGDPWP